ncbi:hypothetical protein [Enterococcus wangshanyuanii]|uniref:Uncharacterized protein n=1 Tax=Enterococcus wangshanyuanii TaxID=2005703 RepID=A0ABQ1PJY7_9ENTE|nr:hypothetical protein [Enterococcus wangshanyuanii]GGC98129.1 hypothetical protein GCM10011573_29580 [Enterococcus wangshanyuanii]
MTRDQYVESVRVMMDNQDRYFMWFLGILGVVLVFVGILQWRLSSNQIKKITTDAKEEARKEIMEELTKNYGIKSINTLLSKSKEFEEKITKISNSLEMLDFEKRRSEELQFYNDLREIPKTENCTYELLMLLATHSIYVSKDEFDIVAFVEAANRDQIVRGLEMQEDTFGFREYINELHKMENRSNGPKIEGYINSIEKIYADKLEARR